MYFRKSLFLVITYLVSGFTYAHNTGYECSGIENNLRKCVNEGNQLTGTYNRLRAKFAECVGDIDKLGLEFNSNLDDYESLFEEHDDLIKTYNSLVKKHNNLQKTYNSLVDVYTKEIQFDLVIDEDDQPKETVPDVK